MDGNMEFVLLPGLSYIVSFAVIGVAILVLMRFAEIVAEGKMDATWFLALGICLSFFGRTCLGIKQVVLNVQQEHEATYADYYVVDQIFSIFDHSLAIAAGICHLIAVTIFFSRKLTATELMVTCGMIALFVIYVVWHLQ